MADVTTWFNYLSGTPIDDADLWQALSVLDVELEASCQATGVYYSYTPFYGVGITTVAAALNKIGGHLAALGTGSGVAAGLLPVYDDDDPLYDGYTYAQWVMPASGVLKLGDFWVDTAPSGGTCTLGIYVNGVLKLTITIADGANAPTAVTDCSAVVYIARDIISLRTITCNSAGILIAAMQL